MVMRRPQPAEKRALPPASNLIWVLIMPMVNPKLLPIPTMIIHGEYDDVADLDGLLPVFTQLPNPYKRT